MHYNVLLPETKQTLKKEYQKRFLAIIFFGVTIVGIFAFISLIPSFVSLRIHEKNAANESQILARLKAEEGNDGVNKTIQIIKNKITLLEKNPASFEPTDLITKLLDTKPAAISAYSILYEPKGTGHLLTVSGVAKTRNDLLAFRDAIQKVPPFEKVDFPVTVLAKNTDVSFTFTISGSF